MAAAVYSPVARAGDADTEYAPLLALGVAVRVSTGVPEVLDPL